VARRCGAGVNTGGEQVTDAPLSRGHWFAGKSLVVRIVVDVVVVVG